jgi:hypothetical protein
MVLSMAPAAQVIAFTGSMDSVLAHMADQPGERRRRRVPIPYFLAAGTDPRQSPSVTIVGDTQLNMLDSGASCTGIFPT